MQSNVAMISSILNDFVVKFGVEQVCSHSCLKCLLKPVWKVVFVKTGKKVFV